MANLAGEKNHSFDEGAYLWGVKTWSFEGKQLTGGGHRALFNTDGDYPVAALRGVKTQQTINEGAVNPKAADDFEQSESDAVLTILAKNVNSLQGDHREDELLAELRLTSWDVV